MKQYGWLVLLGLAVVMNGCGTIPLKNGSYSSRHQKNPQMDDFASLGDVLQTAGGLRLTISTDDLFEKGLTSLTVNGTREMDTIAAVMVKYPKDFVSVNVFTDSSADTDYQVNEKLSESRANAVKDELVKRGVSLSSVTSVGKGSAQPIAVNDTDQNMAKNRRIEFEITTRQ
jgi:outer membrane protein OmpA-like peptidoglycan-associated protein